jgi:hypothetical protein
MLPFCEQRFEFLCGSGMNFSKTRFVIVSKPALGACLP